MLGSEATQGEVFEAVAPVVAGVACGVNACVMAYGQTGSGKTHTMLGRWRRGGGGGGAAADEAASRADAEEAAHEGVLPRAVRRLFAQLDRRVKDDEAPVANDARVENDERRPVASADEFRSKRRADASSTEARSQTVSVDGAQEGACKSLAAHGSPTDTGVASRARSQQAGLASPSEQEGAPLEKQSVESADAAAKTLESVVGSQPPPRALASSSSRDKLRAEKDAASARREEWSYEVQCSFLQIHGDALADLLVAASEDAPHTASVRL